MWYKYEGGGWWNNASYTFQTGENGDVLHLPYGTSYVMRRGNTATFEVNGGYLTLQLEGGSYLKSTFDGSNIFRWSIADDAANFLWYDPNVNFYSFAGDSGTLASFGDSWGNGVGIYLNEDTMRAKNLGVFGGGNYVLFGNSLDNYIQDSYGSSQIWGGWGNDILSGGGGADRFFFGWSNGNDVILDLSDDDVIDLYSVNSWEVNLDTALEFDGWNTITLRLNDGSTLEMHSSSGGVPFSNYKFADGVSYSYYGKSRLSWSYSWDAAEDTGAEIASNPLWGDANTFYGTDAADNIFLSKNDGNDLVFDTAQGDTIHFCDAVLSDVIATAVNDNAVAIVFNTGETAVVAAEGNVSTTFKLASGESYAYNRETSSWQEA